MLWLVTAFMAPRPFNTILALLGKQRNSYLTQDPSLG